MQSWSNNGQNGADDTQQWHNNYAFTGQNGQYDPHQAWSQPMTDQAAYSHINPQDASPSNFFDSDQNNSFLTSGLHGSPPNQGNYHAGHDSLGLNQQFSQPSQDVMDPAFSDIHSDLYGQHGKIDLDNAMAGVGQISSHPHSSTFSYGLVQPNEPSFESPIQQYPQPHVIPQPSRQQSHTPVQQFEGLPGAFAHGHGFSRPPQQSPVQNQQSYTQAAFSPPVNGQTPQPQSNEQLNFQQSHQQARQQPTQQPHQSQQQQTQQPQPYSQAQYAPKQPLAYPQTTQPMPNQNFQQPVHQQQPPFMTNSSPPPTTTPQYMMQQAVVDQDAGVSHPNATEPPAKKRKRAAKSAPETPTPEPATIHADSPAGSPALRKVDDIDTLTAPTPSPEDAQLIAQFNKRPKAAQAKHPAIKGLPYLIYDGTTKLPAPKSYDKLAPLVALPARSGRQMVPELGYSLPCEVQGRFTSQYRPSSDKGGLDERRIEAKVLLDEFDRAMKGLGKRRPKYTEYPHAFKEQLKSDEASKNKAEKKAKRELEEVRNKPIRSATRPADPADAAAWDAIGMVHVEQSVARTNALIAGRVQQAGEYFIKLRGEMNRAKQELDQAIKDKEAESEISKFRQEFERKKEILYRALDATIEHADDAVLDNLGGHQKLVLSLVNALIMCIKSSDFSGKLPKIVLELFTHFPMTKKIAETTNFETVRKRFADKGDAEVKELAQEISAKIKKLKASEPETATGYTGTSAASRAKSTSKSGNDHSTKRGRDEEGDTRTVKKIAIESSGNSLSRKLAQPKIQLQSASKTTAAKAAAASILPGKSRPVAKSAPKPEPKAEIKSTVDDKPKTAPKTPRSEPKPHVPQNGSSSAASSLSSGIASLLDSINAPKADSPAAPKETNGPETSETPEEKAKRLRKEARRKLRVSWKPESELVQVKIFHKEEAEDEGREVNMIRDAGDDRSEGMVLKQRANVDDEDEDDDIPYQPWVGPVATDFSRLPDDTRNKNFVNRGGNVTFTTDEQQRIAEREQRELMAIYTDPDDIPPTPKSPPPEMAGSSDWKTQYLPDDAKFQEIQLRWRDEQQMGVDGALYSALQRIDAKGNPSNRLDSILGRLRGAPSAPSSSAQSGSLPQQSYGTANENLPIVAGNAAAEQVLTLLRSDKVKNWRDPAPATTDVWRTYHYTDTPTRLCGGAIEGVAKNLANKPAPATSPPEWILHDPEKVREWQMGYNKEMMTRQKRADEERARTEAEANALRTTPAAAAPGQPPANPQDWAAYYAQQQAYAPYMALLQQMTGGQQPTQQQASATPQQQGQIPDSQLQSILAAINQPSQQPAQAPASNSASYLNPNDPSYQQYMMLSQMAQGQQAAPPPPPAAERDWDRDRDRERDRDRDREWDRDRMHDRDRDHDRNRDDHHGGRGEREGKDGRRKRGTLPPHKPANKALIGTKPCTFWQQGKCARGDKCTFRHD
ncbi:hypothetical protein LCI18_011915 [Fusarium solani-melongenae]|uniref:Uncharacterized protein n=1 Tax=Fusarium solani subsp. cucurbitae TaxID=2747967 RepID=A0ACD3ZIF8_FUSSC|nr:hypothetical protein LCI18_011915 [Fusarium solani-melongenae]